MGLSVRGLESALVACAQLDLADGEVVGLGGASGSGKTLLLRAISDLDPNTGEVTLDGIARDSLSGPAWRQRVRYVAAESGWWDQQVGAHFADPPGTAADAVALGLPAGCMEWPVARLSSGERQRLALLRALEDAPRVLLLDEPTATLDETATAAVEALIRFRCASGACALLVSHDRGQAERMSQRRFRIEDGRLLRAR